MPRNRPLPVRLSIRALFTTAAVAVAVLLATPVSPANAMPGQLAATASAAKVATRITASIPRTAFGTGATVKIQVIGATRAVPTGTVQVYSGSSALGHATLSRGADSIRLAQTTSPGTRALTIRYFGSSGHAASSLGRASFVVVRATPTITTSAHPATYPARASVSISVRGPITKPTGRVVVRRSGKTITTATLSAGSRTIGLPALAPGTHALSLAYAGDMRFAARSATVSVRIAAAPKPVVAKKYANCTALRKVYPHGVGEPGARDHVTSGKPVTTLTVSLAVYGLNTFSDRGHDGIAYEQH